MRLEEPSTRSSSSLSNKKKTNPNPRQWSNRCCDEPQAGDDAYSFRYRTRTSEAHWISLPGKESFHYSWLHQEFPQNPQQQIQQHNRNNYLLQPKGKQLNAPNDPKNFKTWLSLCLFPEEILLLLLLLQKTNCKLISVTKLGRRESFKLSPKLPT